MASYPRLALVVLANLVKTNMLTTCKVHLFTAVANPLGPNTVLADFTEAAYGGYAAQTAAFNPAFVNVAGQAECDSPLLVFQPTNSATPEVVLGYYVTDSGGTALLWAGTFPAPVNMLSPADACPVVLQFQLQPPS